jgi:hypothetical protein
LDEKERGAEQRHFKKLDRELIEEMKRHAHAPPPSQHTALSSPRVAGSVDGAFEHDRIVKRPGELNERDFTYFLLGGARVVYASAVRLALVKLVASMQPAADVLALSSTELDVSAIREGSTFTVKWRGKPVFIRHRTAEEVQTLHYTTLLD